MQCKIKKKKTVAFTTEKINIWPKHYMVHLWKVWNGPKNVRIEFKYNLYCDISIADKLRND